MCKSMCGISLDIACEHILYLHLQVDSWKFVLVSVHLKAAGWGGVDNAQLSVCLVRKAYSDSKTLPYYDSTITI